MSHSLFSQNPWYSADIIRGYKPDFTPRVAFILGSGLGALADQIEDAVAISYEKLPGFPVSTVHGHAGELVLGNLAGIPVACMKGRGHFYEGRGMTVMTDAIRTLKLLGCELLFCTNAAGSLRPEVGPTDFNMKVNESSSYIVYITKSKEIYSSIYQMEMKKRELLHDQLGWYYSVGGHAPVQQDCRAPEFFHGDNFLMVCVEHNNGDWNKQPTYKLYIAE